MKIQRSVFSAIAITALGASALAGSGAAQAGQVAWSVGISSPGVQLGVSGGPHGFYRQPVYGASTVYYSQPQVVYATPAVTYVQPTVSYVQPQVSYVQPQVIYAPQTYYAPRPYYVGASFAPPIYYRDGGVRHHGYGPRWNHDRRH